MFYFKVIGAGQAGASAALWWLSQGRGLGGVFEGPETILFFLQGITL